MAEGKLKGVKRRKDTGVFYYEQRFGGGKLFSTKIDSAEVGALCYDIGQLYNELDKNEGNGRKRKATTKLNYEKYSRSLQPLQDLPKDCDKEVRMEIILKQARAAASNLPKNRNQDVGSQSPNNRSSSHHTVHVKPLGLVEGKQDLPSESRHAEALEVLQRIFEPIMGLRHAFTRKVNERKELEFLVAGVKNSGVILLPDLGPDNFEDELACLKLLFSADLSRRIEVVEQEYNSEEFKCRKLREIVQDHNSKSIHEGLMRDGDMTGRQRADESVRLPTVIEICSPDERKAGSVSDGVSKCLSPASSPVDVEQCETDTTMLPVEMEKSQHVAQYDESAPDHNAKSIPRILMRDGAMTGRQRADEDGRLLEVLESCSPDEQNAGSVPDGVSRCRGPASSPVDIEPCEIDTAMLPVGMDVSQHVAQYDECSPDHTSKSVSVSLMGDVDMPICRQRADEMGRPLEELESCSPDEPKAGSMSDDANICYDPPECSPDDFACLLDITIVPTLSVELDMLQPVAPVEIPFDDDLYEILLIDANFRRDGELDEDEDEGIRLWSDDLITDGD